MAELTINDTGLTQKDKAADKAVVAFIVSMVGVLLFWPLGPVAWYLGAKALKAGPSKRRDLAMAAKVIGIVTTILFGIALVAIAIVAYLTLNLPVPEALNLPKG